MLLSAFTLNSEVVTLDSFLESDTILVIDGCTEGIVIDILILRRFWRYYSDGVHRMHRIQCQWKSKVGEIGRGIVTQHHTERSSAGYSILFVASDDTTCYTTATSFAYGLSLFVFLAV